MAKIISLFNHKGGVSKTTTTYHLGWMLADLGHKVLIVDADPQCNLTGLTLGIVDYDSLFDFYSRKSNNDIYSSLAGEFGFAPDRKNLENGIDTTPTGNPNLNILAGHIDFAKFDLQIATALTSSMSIPLLTPLIGAINKLIRNTAEKKGFDIVLIDMSPSISATNMCLFMASDYFIIPTSPDFFCSQAIDSLANVFPDWVGKTEKFKDGITLSLTNPKLLGIITQNYRVYTKEDSAEDMTKEFLKWSDKIKQITNETLIPALEKLDMVVSVETFKKNISSGDPYNLANIPNFNSLIPASQKLSKPVFNLTESDLPHMRGAIWEREQDNKKVGNKYVIEKAKTIYTALATAISGMIS